LHSNTNISRLAENPEGRAPQGYFVVLHLLLELRKLKNGKDLYIH